MSRSISTQSCGGPAAGGGGADTIAVGDLLPGGAVGAESIDAGAAALGCPEQNDDGQGEQCEQ